MGKVEKDGKEGLGEKEREKERGETIDDVGINRERQECEVLQT